MCRIFGCFGDRPKYNELKQVSLLQVHGGPDSQSIVAGENWGLGNNRLAIMDPNGGQQPFSLYGIQVVFNGEIYNHHSLRQKLSAMGYAFDDHCDGNVLPALYDAYGDDFVDHLDGMFAIAIVDLRKEPRLILVNDHAGMKSLYYQLPSARNNNLYFASELPALFGFEAVVREEDAGALENYLAHKSFFGSHTAYKGIHQLEPRTTLTYSLSHGVNFVTRPSPTSLYEEEAGLNFRDALSREIQSLLSSDVPVCAITSGGLDSSLVTAMASRFHPELHTFNIAYEGNWPADESSYALEVSRQANTVHHQIRVAPETFPDLLDDVIWHLGQPNADPITLSTYALFKEVRQAGFKVALTGDAADELLGGYERTVSAMSNSQESWAQTYRDALSAIPLGTRASLYSDEYREHALDIYGRDKKSALVESYSDNRYNAITRHEIERRMPAYHLRRVDHMSMAHSVEARMPFCQRSIMALASAVPGTDAIRNGRGKTPLYEAGRGLLPDSVLNRRKQPFTLPITSMLATGQPLMEHAAEVLTDPVAFSSGQLSKERIQALLNAQMSNPSDLNAMSIWSLMVFTKWRMSLNSRAPSFQSSRISEQVSA